MANIAPTPIVLNDIDALIGADNYEASLSRCILEPTTPVVRWKGMTPAAQTALAGTPTWVARLAFAQDHVAAASLSRYLLANVGKVVTFKFKPKKGTAGSTPTYTIDILIVPGAIGGELDALATGEVSLECVGQPVHSLT